MRVFSSKWPWLTAVALSLGLFVAGNNFTQAWQNQTPRLRANTNPQLDDSDPEEQVERSIPGQITLPKCSVKLLHSVTLASDRPGLISFVEPREGDDVRKDQEIVFLKDDELMAIFEISKEKAENDVNKQFAEASADVAKVELEKMLESNRRVPGSITSTEVERGRLNYIKAQLQGKQAEHEQVVARLEMKKAAAQLKAGRIEAPFDGKVRKVIKHKGEAVTQGTPILELVSTRIVKVEGYLPVEDLWSVKRGDPVEVQIVFPDRNLEIEKEVFHGKMYSIDPTVSNVTHRARVWAEVQNPDEKLIEGLYAKMTIKHGRRAAGTAKKAPVASGIKQAGGEK